MTSYVGNNKIDKIFAGNVEIGKVYLGNELIYQSGPSLMLYGMTFPFYGETEDAYLIGEWSTNGIIVWPMLCTITNITGTLGESGSTISYKLTEQASTSTQSYNSTIEVAGVKIYKYINSNDLVAALVLEKSVVGSTFIASVGGGGYPTSVTSTTVIGGGYTYTKDSSLDATWYTNGIR